MKKRFGFTLLEVIIVIIIIGILATLGFVQYTTVLEKSRKGEARAILGTLRALEVARSNEPGGGFTSDIDSLSPGLPSSACANTHFFTYACAAADGTCTASRCSANGKTPDYTSSYTITLTTAGAFGGSWQ